jgi:hypothetical protein
VCHKSVFFLSVLYGLTQRIIYLLAYLFTPRSKVLLDMLNGSQLVKKFPQILWNPKFHHRIHKYPSPFPIFSQLNPVHTLTSLFLKTHFNIIFPSTLGFLQWSPYLRFPHQNLYTAFPYPMRPTSPTHLILLYFITRTILGEEYGSLTSSLRSFLHSPVTSSL